MARLAIANPAMRSRGLCGACLVRSRAMMGVFIFFNFLGLVFMDGVILNYRLSLPLLARKLRCGAKQLPAWSRGSRADGAPVWGAAVCARPWLRSGGCARA